MQGCALDCSPGKDAAPRGLQPTELLGAETDSRDGCLALNSLGL